MKTPTLALILTLASLTCVPTPAPAASLTLRSIDYDATVSERSLCAIERGKYCTPRSPTDVQPPAAVPDEGWVCCAPQGTPCVAVASYGDCTFVGGWCVDFTTNDDDTVTCHD